MRRTDDRSVWALVQKLFWAAGALPCGQEDLYFLLDRVLSESKGADAFARVGGVATCIQVLKNHAHKPVSRDAVLLLGKWAYQCTCPSEAFNLRLDVSPLFSFVDCPRIDVAKAAKRFLTLYCSKTQLFDVAPDQSDEGHVHTLKAMITCPIYGRFELFEMIISAISGAARPADSANAFIQAGIMRHIAQTLRGRCPYVLFEGAVSCLCALTGANPLAVNRVMFEGSVDVLIPLMNQVVLEREDAETYYNTPGVFLLMYHLLSCYNRSMPSNTDDTERQVNFKKPLSDVIRREEGTKILLKVNSPPGQLLLWWLFGRQPRLLYECLLRMR
jgi:hypothetical protein